MSQLTPVPQTARIEAIDAVRGVALLGILCVNVLSFGDAFGAALAPDPPPGASGVDLAAFYFVRVFCFGKFYPLFSILFGIGLTIQWSRAHDAGRSFAAAGFRRLGFLMLIGLLHGLLLWYGDILFVYGTAGVALLILLLLRCSPRVMLIIAAILLSISLLLTTGFTLLTEVGASPGTTQRDTQPSTRSAVEDDRPFERTMRALQRGEADLGPFDSKWIEAERQAYREGPFDQVMKFRVAIYVIFLVVSAFGFWWHVLSMFLFVAALFRLGLFSAHRRYWHKRMFLIGMLVGLPLNVLAVSASWWAPQRWQPLLDTPAMIVIGPLLTLGYLGGIALLVERGTWPGVTSALTSTGRMAFTNYLMQTVIGTTIFYYWGFAQFGRHGPATLLAIAFAIYLAQVVFSHFWVSVFRFGPLEWIWRTVTYWKMQPMTR